MRPLVGRKGRNGSRKQLLQRSSKSRLTLLNGMHDITKKSDRLCLPPIDATPGMKSTWTVFSQVKASNL